MLTSVSCGQLLGNVLRCRPLGGTWRAAYPRRCDTGLPIQAASQDDDALQLRSIDHALATTLASLDIDAAVVRGADYHPRTRLTDGVIRRLKMEGVLLSSLRRKVPIVRHLGGREIGATCGSSKTDIQARAFELVEREDVDAAAAAIAASHLVP